MNIREIKEGMKVIVNNGNNLHVGIVFAVDSDIKNGQAGIDYSIIENGKKEFFFAYEDQIVSAEF